MNNDKLKQYQEIESKIGYSLVDLFLLIGKTAYKTYVYPVEYFNEEDVEIYKTKIEGFEITEGIGNKYTVIVGKNTWVGIQGESLDELNKEWFLSKEELIEHYRNLKKQKEDEKAKEKQLEDLLDSM